MDKQIHLITRWTGRPTDETPLCGADPDDRNVWNLRTEYLSSATCPTCHQIEHAHPTPGRLTSYGKDAK